MKQISFVVDTFYTLEFRNSDFKEGWCVGWNKITDDPKMVRRSFQHPQRRCNPFWSLQHREERKEGSSVASSRKPIFRKLSQGTTLEARKGPLVKVGSPCQGQVLAEGRWLDSWVSSGKPPADCTFCVWCQTCQTLDHFLWSVRWDWCERLLLHFVKSSCLQSNLKGPKMYLKASPGKTSLPQTPGTERAGRWGLDACCQGLLPRLSWWRQLWSPGSNRGGMGLTGALVLLRMGSVLFRFL